MSDNEKVIQDQLKGLSINRDGYGFIPKLVMQDNNLDISAKAVYAYFCSFTGAGDSCFPTRKKICYDLKISNDSLSKYLRQLEDNGYIEISQTKESGRFANNVYKLRDVKLPLRKISDTEKTAPEKTDTKNNSSKSNILSKNNSFLKKESVLPESSLKNSLLGSPPPISNSGLYYFLN